MGVGVGFGGFCAASTLEAAVGADGGVRISYGDRVFGGEACHSAANQCRCHGLVALGDQKIVAHDFLLTSEDGRG